MINNYMGHQAFRYRATVVEQRQMFEGSTGIYNLLSKAKSLRFIVDSTVKGTSMSMTRHYLIKLKPNFT